MANLPWDGSKLVPLKVKLNPCREANSMLLWCCVGKIRRFGSKVAVLKSVPAGYAVAVNVIVVMAAAVRESKAIMRFRLSNIIASAATTSGTGCRDLCQVTPVGFRYARFRNYREEPTY